MTNNRVNFYSDFRNLNVKIAFVIDNDLFSLFRS